MFLDQLKVPFRFYTSLAESSMLRENCKGFRYKLITPGDRLLPFMLRFPTPAVPSLPAHLKIYNSDTGAVDVIVADNITIEAIDYYRFGQWDYLVYKGGPLADVVIPSGFHYAEIEMMDGTKFYSEEFWVDCDVLGSVITGDFSNDFNDDFSNQFLEQGLLDGLRKYTKLTWWSPCDIGNLLYQTGYINTLYLEAEPIKSDPEYLEEGSEDGEKNFIPKFVKLTDIVTMQDFMPEHVVDALSAVIIHPYVYVTTKNTGYVGKARRFQCTSKYIGLCYAVTDVKFQMETTLLKSQCCSDNQLTNLYMCPARISGLNQQMADNGNGTFHVSVFWNVDIGAGPFLVTSPQVSGGAPHQTIATNYDFGDIAAGTNIFVEVKPQCQAANGRIIYGNVLTLAFQVGA